MMHTQTDDELGGHQEEDSWDHVASPLPLTAPSHDQILCPLTHSRAHMDSPEMEGWTTKPWRPSDGGDHQRVSPGHRNPFVEISKERVRGGGESVQATSRVKWWGLSWPPPPSDRAAGERGSKWRREGSLAVAGQETKPIAVRELEAMNTRIQG